MIQGEVTALAFGGSGILRHEGEVIFVPYTAPGDQVTCQIVRKAKRYSEAALVSVDVPSKSRVTPKCPYFGTCGGCQLQHLKYEEQCKYKQQSVADALKRIGKFEGNLPPIVPAEMHYGYRRHITLTLQEQKGHFVVGYIADDQQTFLPISQCPIFGDLAKVQPFVGKLKAEPGQTGKLVVYKVPEGLFLQFHFKYLPVNAKEVVAQALDWVGCHIATPEKVLEVGEKELTLSLDGHPFHFSPRAFLQNHPEISLNIYRMVQELAKVKKATTALDLYCGIGILSFLLAKQGVKVTGVESNREAIKMAKRNGCATFISADVKKVLSKLLEKERPDLVIVNPPRVGLEPEVIAAFQEFKPQTLVYISCMPTTLARDLSRFAELGFRLERCQAFDMFPQTGHVETIAILEIV